MKRKKTIKERNFLKVLFKKGDKRNAIKETHNLGSKGGSKTEEQKNNTADRMGQQLTAKLQDDIDAYYKKQDLTIDWVLKRLAFKADHSKNESNQIKCIELIGKNKKAFTDVVKVEIDWENVKIVRPDIGFKKKVE